MNLLERLINYLSYELEKAPSIYGGFHIFFLILTFFISYYLIVHYRKTSKNQCDRTLFIISIVMILFEVYKQFVYSYQGNQWHYQWYIFPFQFCSVPMYISLITSLLKEGKLKTIGYAFLGTFSLFAGLAVMFYPGDVFTRVLGISIQTMIHHGAMVVMGLYVLAIGKVKLEHQTIIGASLLFIILVTIAFLLNIIFRNVDGTFNMFYIGPYYPNHLPVLSQIQTQFGYLIFLVAYVLGFIFVAYLVLLISILVSKTIKHLQKEKHSHSIINN